jgi:hypothetical protein
MDKIQILPQTIFEFKSTPELLYDTQRKVEDLTWEPNLYTQRSIDIYLNKNHLFNDLHEWFHECLVMVKRSVEYQATDIQITQSWANRADQGQWHEPHKHPNSIFSGIYYLTDNVVGTTFMVKNIWDTYNGYDGKIGESFCHFLQHDRSFVETVVKGDPGKLLIFPSILQHGVRPNESEETRYTISFNSFLCGDIGSFGNLSGLTLDIK